MAQAPNSGRKSLLSRTDGAMPSARRFTSLFGSPLPSPAPGASLPAINNLILQRRVDAVNTLQQHMLEQELILSRPAASATSGAEEDDAPLPSTRYTHMSDMLVPDNDAATFFDWKASMEQQMQQWLASQRQQQPPNEQLSPVQESRCFPCTKTAIQA